jgi:hypothetical protein
MKIQPRRNKAMAVATFVIVIVLIVVIILGIAYLIAKVKRFVQKITPPPPPDDPAFVQLPKGYRAPLQLPSNFSGVTASAFEVPTPFGAITLPPGSPITNNLIHFFVQSSSNLVDWVPLTNFYCTVDEIEQVWMIPIANVGSRFFRIGAGEPTP